MKYFDSLWRLIREKASAENVSEMGWVFSGQLVVILYGFAVIKIISRLGEAVYGKYVLIMTVASLASMLLFGPLTQGFMRYYFHYLSSGRAGIFVKYIYSNLFRIVLALLLVLCGGTLLYSLFVPMDDLAMLLLSVCFILVLKVGEFQNSHLNTLRKRKINSLLQALEKSVIVASAFLLIFTETLSLNNMLKIFILPALVFSVIKQIYLWKLLPSDGNTAAPVAGESSQMRKALAGYITPFLIWGIAGWLQLNGEKWIIANLLSTSDVGVYGVMVSLINVFIAVPNTIIADFSTPLIFRKFSDLNNKSDIREGFRLIWLTTAAVASFMCLSVVITYFAGDLLIRLISSGSFTRYSYLLPLLSVGTGLFYVGQTICFPGMALNMPQKYLVPKITLGIVSVLFNTVFLSIFGIDGLAPSIILSSAVYCLHILYINKKIISRFY